MKVLMSMRFRFISVKSLKSHCPKITQQDFAGILKQVENPSVHCWMIILNLLPKTYLDEEDAITGTSKLSK
jgi:hypothetical protein